MADTEGSQESGVQTGRKTSTRAARAGANRTLTSQEGILGLCDTVRETAFKLHCYLRHGHLEKVYENGLAHRLRKRNLKAEQQFPLTVVDEDGTPLGQYYADLMVEGCLVVEIKACETLASEHIAQVLGYLRSSQIEHGLLINFGAPRLQIKKLVLSRE